MNAFTTIITSTIDTARQLVDDCIAVEYLVSNPLSADDYQAAVEAVVDLLAEGVHPDDIGVSGIVSEYVDADYWSEW